MKDKDIFFLFIYMPLAIIGIGGICGQYFGYDVVTSLYFGVVLYYLLFVGGERVEKFIRTSSILTFAAKILGFLGFLWSLKFFLDGFRKM